jgi:Tfp pilus tip-associated adhesin PilY1
MMDLLKIFAATALLGASIALAVFDPVNDDTDIFLANPNITANRPNVLIILDNTANWNTAFTNEKNALVQVVNGLNDSFNVGLMMFAETGGGNDNVDGGYVRFHVRQMTLQNKTRLATMVGNLHQINDRSNNAGHGQGLYEAYLYYGGKASVASHGKVKADKDNTTDPILSLYASPDHALPASTGATNPPPLYRSPIADGCARNFVILISNGPADNSTNEMAVMQGRLATLTGVSPPSVISVTPSGRQGNWSDEMARFMANADVMATSTGIPNSEGVQNVYTYVVEVDPGTTGQGPDWTAVMKSTAANGKGKYFAVSSNASGVAIVDALNAIFNEVQAVNSVFASTTLPVSVNVRGTNLNQVYIGVFRPDANKAPRWLGNLKMYNLALNTATGQVFLADAANGPPPAVGNPAESTTTGFISQNSPSFWTQDSTFWSFRDPSQNGPGGASDKPDGDLVEKGGAAQQLRIAFANAEGSSPARNLYTCTTGTVGGVNQTCTTSSLLANTPFSTANDAINAAALQLDTRLVSPLTAFETLAVASLTDRRAVVLNNTNPGNAISVSSISNGATTRTITNLTTAVPKPVKSLTAQVPNVQTVALSSVGKFAGNYRFEAAAALPGNFVVGATVLIQGTSNSNFNGNSYTISAIDTVNKRFTISGGPSGNESATGGTATVTSGTINSTTAQAVLDVAHGFVSGQSVTIAGASPTQFNGTFNITVIDANRFNYTISTAAGNASGSITVSGNTSIATATTSSAHPFLAGTVVNISGASLPQYNGPKTIIDCQPAPSCDGTATTFRYSVGVTIGPNTASPVYAVQGGGTLVTVTTTTAHGFLDGDVVVISGSDIPGYNGSWRIACPGGCIPAPPVPPALPAAPTQFTFNTATDNVAPTAPITSVLPPNSSTAVTASLAGATVATVRATAANHGFSVNDQVVIESVSTPADTSHPGTYTVLTVPDANTFTYSTGTARPQPSGNFTVRPPTASSRAIVTVTGAWTTAVAVGDPVTINNANPVAYNGTHNITRIVNANTFEYALTTAPGTNTSTAATASIRTTTARATAVNHGFANGSTVSIAGATPADFNGSKVITVIDANTFTYTIATRQGDATGTITAAQTGGPSGERDQIIRWVRGEDNFQDENANGSLTDIRASVHGDVLHSRPAVVNYNRFSGSDDDVFVFYGSNDGIFRAVKGGYAVPPGDTSGLTPGREAWGFIPEEFFGQFKRMRNNSPTISSAFKKPYFMDGPIGVYTRDTNGNSKLGDDGDFVNLYIANRRGGRFLYALDVNKPLEPRYLWRISNNTPGFSELGQTWSQPTVVSGLAGIPPTTPVLLFGAGYDPAIEDLDPAVVTSVNTTNGSVTTTTVGTVNRTMGRGIYVVNALTGELIWRALGAPDTVNPLPDKTTIVPGMIYAIPSDITVIRPTTAASINRAYVGDTGGNVWRIDFRQDSNLPSPNLAATIVTKLASVADPSTPSGRRKFLFPPDVVEQVGFDAVLIGSGDREHPFDTTVTNRFYMFKDKGPDTGPITGATTCDPTITEGPIPDPGNLCDPNPGPIPGLSDLTSNCIQNAADCLPGEDQATVSAKLGTDRGWYITLRPGEKVVGNAVSISGTTFFNTNQPSATAGGGTCGSNLGIARQYQIATADATATSDLNAVGGLTGADRSLIHAGGGYLPSPVHVVVMLGGKPVEAVISGVQVSTPPGASLSARLRKFWYKEVDFR